MENEGYETIDLLEVLNAVRQHLLAVILATVILAAARVRCLQVPYHPAI